MAFENRSSIESQLSMLNMLRRVAIILFVIGFLFTLVGIGVEFSQLSTVDDTVTSVFLVTLLFVGIGFALSGIFFVLVIIVRTLKIAPSLLKEFLSS